MKHRKWLSLLLALVMVLSLAPTMAFAVPDVYPYPYVPDDNVHVQNVRKVWQYADGTEIPADELAALIEQGVIPETLDVLYILQSSDDSQTGCVRYDGAIIHALGEVVDLWNLNPDGSSNPDGNGWISYCFETGEFSEEGCDHESCWNHTVLDDYPAEYFGGWSRQTLSQDNGWATDFDYDFDYEFMVDYWTPGWENYPNEFSPYYKTFNLFRDRAVTYTFAPYREFIPDGYPLVSGTERTDGSWDDYWTGGAPVDYWNDWNDWGEDDEGYAAAAQAWDEAGDVIMAYTATWYDTMSVDAEVHVSVKEYGDGWVTKVHYIARNPNNDYTVTTDSTGFKLIYPVTFTNTYSGERPWKDITVTKIWDDEVETSRPESITVNLLANGTKVDSQTVTADDDWACTFEDVPVYSEGEKIDYTVSEEAVPGYETTVDGSESDGFTITNTCTSGTIQIVKKTEGAQTPDGTRFTISGTPDAQGAAFRPVTVRYADFENGVYTLKNVPAGTYTVTEHTNDATLAGYELTVSGNGATKTLRRGDTVKFVITNEYERTTEEIPVHPTPTPTPAPALNTEDHYAYIIGYPDGLVRPNGTITRAEVVTVFFRMLTDASRDAIWSTENSFTDVQLNEWFNNAISTIENGGIINGYPDGSFNPNGNITRAEFAAMAIRFFQDAKVGPSKFSDTIGHWAAEAISKAQNEGLIMGYPDGTFHPDQPITRAEAMTIFNRVLKRAPHKDHLVANMIQWPDNMNKAIWYYADVQEATNSHTYTMSDTTTSAHEIWQKLLPVRDWEAFEKAWSTAHSASNPGEVVNN